MTHASKITVVEALPKKGRIAVSEITPRTAFTGRLVGIYGSPYIGLFLRQGRELIGLDVMCDGKKLGVGQFDKPGNIFFGINDGTVEDFLEVDLEIKVVPHVP